MRLGRAPYRVPQAADAGTLIAALCEVPLERWYAAAVSIASDPELEMAEQALDLALRSADPIQLWNAHDDLDTALYRLTSPLSNSGLTVAQVNRIRATTRRAVAALVCSGMLDASHLLTLTSPLIDLIGEGASGV